MYSSGPHLDRVGLRVAQREHLVVRQQGPVEFEDLLAGPDRISRVDTPSEGAAQDDDLLVRAHVASLKRTG